MHSHLLGDESCQLPIRVRNLQLDRLSQPDSNVSYDTATIAGFQAMVGFLKVYGYPDKKAKIGWNIASEPFHSRGRGIRTE